MESSSGTLRYSPKLLGANSSKWWIILDCDPDIGEYYRHLYFLQSHKTEKLQRPAWKEHISVAADEEPPNKEFWEKHVGEVVKFWYDTIILTDGNYCWLTAYSDRLKEIRIELGLKPEPIYPFHLTVGNHKLS